MDRLSSLITPCYTLNLYSFLCTRRRRSPQHLVGQHKDLGITLSPVRASLYAAVLMHTDDIRTHLTPLVEELREHNTYLKQIISIRDEELRRKYHIIAALTERTPELEAPREVPQTAPDLHPGFDPQDDDVGQETAKSGRSCGIGYLGCKSPGY